MDVPVLLDLCAREAPHATICIELGALEARHVRLLEDGFWQGYPPRRVAVQVAAKLASVALL